LFFVPRSFGVTRPERGNARDGASQDGQVEKQKKKKKRTRRRALGFHDLIIGMVFYGVFSR